MPRAVHPVARQIRFPEQAEWLYTIAAVARNCSRSNVTKRRDKRKAVISQVVVVVQTVGRWHRICEPAGGKLPQQVGGPAKREEPRALRVPWKLQSTSRGRREMAEGTGQACGCEATEWMW